jgi:predicted nucleic acid-binding protein
LTERLPMKDRAFLDTNILIYAYSYDEVMKRRKVLDIFKKYDCYTSTQNLNEFSNVCLKKLSMPVSLIQNAIDEIKDACFVSQVDIDIIKQALTLCDKYCYSYYDSLVVSSALNSNCKYLITEDMSNNQLIENKLLITNIFKSKQL